MRTIELRMNVIYPNLSWRFCWYPRREREQRRRAYEFAPRNHANVLSAGLTLSQANCLAFGDEFSGKSRRQFAQVIVIEKPGHVPGVHKGNEFTPRGPPDEWFSAPAQPPID